MKSINDLQAAVRNILANNGLTELSFEEPDELNDPTYIIWFDNDCRPYDDPVHKVRLEKDGITVELHARDFGNTVTVYDHDIDRIEWWEGIRANLLEVLGRDGRRRCPVCGKPLKGKRRYCGDNCRKLATPERTAEQVAKKANRNIRRLASLAAGKDKAYKEQLIKKYSIGQV